MERIEGRTAFITGAGSGIGLAIAEALVANGAKVVMADWHREVVDAEATRLGALPVHLDVTDRAGWSLAKVTAENIFGPVEILVNNAGIAPDLNELADMPPESFDRLVAIKLTGSFNGIHTFAAGMRARGEGHIVNTASMAGLMASARLGAYTASKFAVVGMSEVLRAELEAHGVGVSVLCPGMVRTNLVENTPPGLRPPDSPDGTGSGIDPALVGTEVIAAIRENRLYIITHGEYGSFVAERSARLQQAFFSAPNHSEPGTKLPGTDVSES